MPGKRDEKVSGRDAGRSDRSAQENVNVQSGECGSVGGAIQCWLTEPVLSKPRGRKPAKTLAEYKVENKQWKMENMENELLRGFLRFTGREAKDKIRSDLPAYKRISDMCGFFQKPGGGCYAFVHRLDRPEKDAALTEIITQQRERSFRTYDCRRRWLVLKKRGIQLDSKTILRIVENMVCPQRFGGTKRSIGDGWCINIKSF